MSNDLENFEGIKIVPMDELSSVSNKSLEKEEDNEEREVTTSEEDDSSLKIVPPSRPETETTSEDGDPAATNNDQGSEGLSGTDDVRTQRIKQFAQELIKDGLLNEEDLGEDFEYTIDNLKGAVNNTVEKRTETKLNEYRQSFSGHKKLFLEIEDAFDDETVAMKVAEDLNMYNNLNTEHIESDKDLQKELYGRALSMKGLTDKEIQEAIDDADSLDKLESKAKEALPELKEQATKYVDYSRQQKLQRQKQFEEQSKKQVESILSRVDSTEKIADDLPYTGHIKNKMKELMTTPVFKDDKGNQYNDLGYKQAANAQGFEVLIQYYNALGLFNTDKEGNFKPDFSKIKKSLNTKNIKEVADAFDKDGDLTIDKNKRGASGSNALDFFEALEKDLNKRR